MDLTRKPVERILVLLLAFYVIICNSQDLF